MRRNLWYCLAILGFLLIGVAATWEDPALRNKMVSIFKGATATVAGKPGAVPAPAAGDEAKALLGNGTWGTISAGSTGVESPCAINTTTSITGWPLALARGGTGNVAGLPSANVIASSASRILGSRAIVGGNDANALALLHGDEATLIDSSPSARTVTAVGAAARSATQSKFGGYAIAFGGAGNHLTLPTSTDWEPALNADYSVDFWMFTSQSDFAYVMGRSTGSVGAHESWHVRLNQVVGKVSFLYYGNTTGTPTTGVMTCTTTVNDGAWHLVSIVRSAGTWTLKVDNAGAVTASDATACNPVTAPLVLGNCWDLNTGAVSATPFVGYLDEVRISNNARTIAINTAAYDNGSPATSELTGAQALSVIGIPMFSQSTADARILQLAAGDTFTAGLGATGQVTLSGAYSGSDVRLTTDTDGAANSGSTLVLQRDVTNGTDSGNFIKCLSASNADYFHIGTNASISQNACTASGVSSTALGSSTTASATASFACGVGGTASGANGAFTAGYLNVASGEYSAAFGTASYAVKEGSLATGLRSKAKRYGEISSASTKFAQPGDQQTTFNNFQAATTNATPTEMLILDMRQVLPATSTWKFTVHVSCYNTTDNLGAAYEIRGSIMRDNANNTSIIGTNITEPFEKAGMEGCDVTVTADDTNEALVITVTGIADKAMRWHATVITSEVSYGTP